jgi:ATP-dependent Clp protease ATP-binding subunit ClpB
MVRIDMSEYMEKHAVARLIGAPPGFVGYEEGGQLTEAVRRKPYAVVLFDEIEKAHGDVFNVLLQVLDDGRLTDGQGRVVNFKNTIVIMTSNIAAAEVAGLDDQKEIENRIQDALRRHFRPEFLNRIDDIIVFHRLGIKELKKVVDIQVAILAERLKAKGITLKLTEKAKDLLGRQGYDPVYGARPLKRVIQKLLQDPIALRILQGELKEGQTIDVEAQGNDLAVETE